MAAAEEETLARLAQLRRDLETAHAEALEQREEELQSEHAAALERALAEHAKAYETLEQTALKMGTNLETAEARLKQVGEELICARRHGDELEDSLQQTRHELQLKGEEVLTSRREAAMALKEREEELAETHRRQLEEMISGYREQFARAREEASKVQGALKAKLVVLQEELNLSEQRFRGRPSREEDVERIALLERGVAERDEYIKAIRSENQRLGLEVMHREQNFNMLFKNTPSVGTINPLAATSSGPAATKGGRGGKPVRQSLSGTSGGGGLTARLAPLPAAAAGTSTPPRRGSKAGGR